MQILIVIIVFLILIYPGMALGELFWQNSNDTFIQRIWMFFWLGIVYVAVIGTNLNFGKIGLHQGGYGLLWLKGWYLMSIIPVVLLLYTNGTIIKKLKKMSLIRMLIVILALLVGTLLAKNYFIHINLNGVDYFAWDVIVNKTVFMEPELMRQGLVGTGMLYSLFGGWLGFTNGYISLIPGLILIVLLPTFTELLRLLNKSGLGIRNMAWIGLIIVGGLRLFREFEFSKIVAFGILLQIIILICKTPHFYIELKKKVTIQAFYGYQLISGLCLIAMLLYDPYLAKLFLFVGISLGVLESIKVHRIFPIINWLKILLIAILINPLMFGAAFR